MSRPVALILMVAVAAASFFAGRTTVSSTAPDKNRRADAERSATRPTQEAYDDLFRKFEETSQSADRLRSELDEALSKQVEPEPAPEPEATDRDPSAPQFVFESHAEVLKQIDWAVIGKSFEALPPLLGRLHRGISEGKNPMQIEGFGDIQRWNGPLLNEAAKIQQAGISGTGVNGPFTHPAFIVNQVYAALASSEQELSDSQVEQLRALGDRYVAAEATRAASYDDTTYGLQQVIEECALKDRLYGEIDALATPEQLAVLHPDDVRGFTQGDLFSSGMVWLQVARPMAFLARSDLAEQVANKIILGESLPAAHHELARSIIAEWASALPDDLLAEPLSPRAGSGMMKVTHITATAHEFLKLRYALATRVPDEAFQQRVKNGVRVLVPYRKTAK